MKDRLHQECYTRSCRELEEKKRLCYKEENGVTQQKLTQHSVHHDQESRTASLLRDQIRKLQQRLEFIEDTRVFQDPDSPSSFGSAHVSHQALIPSSSKKPGHESRMQRKYTRWYEFSRKRFLIVNLPGECLENDTMIQEILQHHRGFLQKRTNWEKWEWRAIANQYVYPVFNDNVRKMSCTTQIVLSLWLTIPRVLGFVLEVAWQFRVILPRRCILDNSLATRNFRAGV